MKHNWTVTIILIAFFILAQITGLWIISKEAKLTVDLKDNSTKVTFDDTAVGARPETTGSGSLIYILIAIAIGTGLVLVIVKFGRTNLWKIWFFLAVWMALSVSLGSLINAKIFFSNDIAIALALIFALWKLLRPNIIIHNLTEVLMYAGIGLIIVPLFEVKWVVILLLIISLYDMYAVWRSKHMVKMAEFQSKSNLFAGLMIPYSQKDNKIKLTASMNTTEDKLLKTTTNTKPKIRAGKTSTKNAILGGGDIAFPLIFIGTVMNGLILKFYNANPTLSIEAIKATAFMHSSIIIATTTLSLLLLFIFAKKGKFYPAMPFLTAGCLIGWAITLLL